MSTHDYKTATIHAESLCSTHVLVGCCGGLSAVLNVEESFSVLGALVVETEHGTLYMDPDDQVEVYVS